LLLGPNRRDSIGLFSLADRSLHDLQTIKWGGGPIFFSPDGNYLGFSSELGEDSAKQIDVSILATDGTRLITAAAHPGRDTFVGWSPDGKTLLFVSNRTASDALFGIGFADGKVQGAPAMIKADFGGVDVLGLSPAGGLYYRPRRDGSSDIQIAPFDFEAGRWISAPITASGIGQQSNPEWSPDGKSVAYLTTHARVSNRILTIRSQETGRVRELRLDEGSYAPILRWSPDGRSVALGKVGAASGIYRVEVDSGQMSLMVPKREGQQLRVADWSRDGRTIFYHGLLYGDTIGFTLMAKDLDSGRERELIRLVGIQNTNLVSLSPDQTKLYYRRSFPGIGEGAISGNPEGATEFAFIERDLVSGAERELIRRPRLGQPTVSPDGRYLATGGNAVTTNPKTIVLIPVAGGEARELFRVTDEVNIARWAPDSRSLFVVKNRQSQQPEVWWVPIDGRGPQKVPSAGMSPFSLRPHPDGRQVAYVSGVTATGPSEIWVLENFLPAPGAKKPGK
jgi:Tol biopolymer transport system component